MNIAVLTWFFRGFDTLTLQRMLPVEAVWYWRQSCSGAIMFPHSYCVTLICHFLVVEVDPVSMSMLMALQESEAGTNMCWPVL